MQPLCKAAPLFKPATLAALAVIGLAARPAAAQTLYYDTFTGGSGSINGNKPQTDPSGAVYTVNTNAGGDVVYGTADAVFSGTGNNSNLISAFLPLTRTAPGVYSVSALVTPPTNVATNGNPANSNWVAIGFSPSTAGDTEFSSAGPWMLYRASGGYQTFAGPGAATLVSSSSTLGSNATPVPATETVTFDTATNTASFFLNGTKEGAYTYATAPAIADVFVGEFAAGVVNFGSFTSLTVTATPEPPGFVGLGLGLLGLAGLAVKARRRPASPAV